MGVSKENTGQRVRISFKKKNGNIVLRDYNKKDGKRFYLKDVNGDPTTFTLTRTQEFDTSDKFQAAIVEGFRNHSIYAPLLNIIGLEDEAAAYVKLTDKRDIAVKTIKGLGTGARGFARALGINLGRMSELQLMAALLKKAEATPDRIIELKNDPNLVKHILLLEGKEAGIFEEKNGVWYHGQHPMGQSLKAAIAWLDENSDLITGLQKEVAGMLK